MTDIAVVPSDDPLDKPGRFPQKGRAGARGGAAASLGTGTR